MVVETVFIYLDKAIAKSKAMSVPCTCMHNSVLSSNGKRLEVDEESDAPSLPPIRTIAESFIF